MTSNHHEERIAVNWDCEGDKIFGVLHRPLTPQKVPGVLFCHGLEGSKCGRGGFYVELATRLTKVGIASLRFDFRGCGDSEGSIAEMSIERQVRETLLALQCLTTQPFILPDTIAIFGRSLGGMIALTAGEKWGSLKAITLVSVPFYPKYWEEEWLRSKDSHLMNGKNLNPLFLKQFFALNMVSPLLYFRDTPLLVVHSHNDTVVPYTHSEKLLKSREGASATTQFIELFKSDHDLADPKERMSVIERVTDFFKDHLKVSHEQYIPT